MAAEDQAQPTKPKDTSGAQTPASPEDPAKPGDGPGAYYVNARGVVLSLLAVMASSALLVYTLFNVWPVPTPIGEPPVERPDTFVFQVIQTAGSDSGGASPTAPSTGTTLPSVVGTLQAQPAEQPSQRAVMLGDPIAGDAPRRRELWCTASQSDRRAWWVAVPDTFKNIGCVSMFGVDFPLWDEHRLLLLTLLGGALGGLVHTLRSLAWYIGNRKLYMSWLAYYASLPLVGALLAIGFYVVLRGGLFSGPTTMADTSPFGFLAVAFLVGMFSTPAALKLKQVADTFFTEPEPGAEPSPQNAGGKPDGKPEPVKPATPVITSVGRQSRAAGAEVDALVIKGSGFSAASTVKVNEEQPRKPELRSSSEISLPLTEADVARIDAGGDFVLVVIEPGGKASQKHDFA